VKINSAESLLKQPSAKIYSAKYGTFGVIHPQKYIPHKFLSQTSKQAKVENYYVFKHFRSSISIN